MVHDDRNSAYGALGRCGPIRENDPVCRGIVDNACLRSGLSVSDRAFAHVCMIRRGGGPGASAVLQKVIRVIDPRRNE